VLDFARAQFAGAGEIAVTPGRVLRAVAQLLQDRGEQFPGCIVTRFGEYGVAGQFGGKPKIALLEEFPGLSG
jgi:hypothetical protein